MSLAEKEDIPGLFLAVEVMETFFTIKVPSDNLRFPLNIMELTIQVNTFFYIHMKKYDRISL